MVKKSKQIQSKVDELLNNALVARPPINVEGIAKDLNIEIRKEDLKDISGLIYRDGNQVIIGVNKTESEKRQRFTIAHELGHYFLHALTPLFIDKVFAVKLRDQVSSQAVSLEEIEANAFAAELLMPARMLVQDIGKLPHVLDFERDDTEEIVANLAEKYQVSMAAMRNRLSNMGFFQESF